ncbi:MAG: hypothetical protein PHS37_03330 [Candidatus Omnitrophica bacterium]|nr:hypothetical protein [Candidatus Omnitrophota bacterium]
MKRIMCVVLLAAMVLGCQVAAHAAPKVLYDFETDLQGWEIPDWAFEQDDYVGENVSQSKDFASSGKGSMKVVANFAGGAWRGAIVEVMEYMDWTPYKTVSADLYVPADAPVGLRAKLILTVGDDWTWTEMSKTVKLEPGKWVTINANLLPGSMDWKRTNPTDEFRADVRKLDIRVESNKKPVYNGPVYIDNVRVE